MGTLVMSRDILVVAVVMVVGYVLNFLQCTGEPYSQELSSPQYQ